MNNIVLNYKNWGKEESEKIGFGLAKKIGIMSGGDIDSTQFSGSDEELIIILLILSRRSGRLFEACRNLLTSKPMLFKKAMELAIKLSPNNEEYAIAAIALASFSINQNYASILKPLNSEILFFYESPLLRSMKIEPLPLSFGLKIPVIAQRPRKFIRYLGRD